MLALQCSGRLTYAGDLTARPVSSTSTTYPGVAYGHMGDGLQLGYQAAMVSLHSLFGFKACETKFHSF